jgi:LysR family transcriptional regulator, pca operon transcriptional activator
VTPESRIKIRHLACFLEVANRRSFGAAAEALAITQPAVSKAIAELEAILGVAVFERSRRGVFLTGYGEAFQRYAGASLTALRQGVDSVSQAQVRGGHTLAVGALPTTAARIMPAAVQRAKAEGMGATLRIVTGPNEVMLTQLRQGALDLVVGRLSEPRQMQTLAFEYLYSEEIVFAVRPGHPLLASGAAVDLGALADFTVVLPTLSSIIRPEVDRLLVSQGAARLPDVIESVSADFARRYTHLTDTVWIISYGVVAVDLAEGTLKRLPVNAPETRGPVGLTQRAEMPASVSLQILMKAIREVAAGEG